MINYVQFGDKCYSVTPSLIRWAHTQNDPALCRKIMISSASSTHSIFPFSAAINVITHIAVFLFLLCQVVLELCIIQGSITGVLSAYCQSGLTTEMDVTVKQDFGSLGRISDGYSILWHPIRSIKKFPMRRWNTRYVRILLQLDPSSNYNRSNSSSNSRRS